MFKWLTSLFAALGFASIPVLIASTFAHALTGNPLMFNPFEWAWGYHIIVGFISGVAGLAMFFKALDSMQPEVRYEKDPFLVLENEDLKDTAKCLEEYKAISQERLMMINDQADYIRQLQKQLGIPVTIVSYRGKVLSYESPH